MERTTVTFGDAEMEMICDEAERLDADAEEKARAEQLPTDPMQLIDRARDHLNDLLAYSEGGISSSDAYRMHFLETVLFRIKDRLGRAVFLASIGDIVQKWEAFLASDEAEPWGQDSLDRLMAGA